MKKIFETFKPKNAIVGQYIDYYYLDIQPDNKIDEFECFPHFNNTLSLYKSHILLETGEMLFDKTAKPFQIFTPIREKILNVKRLDTIYRIVIVFHPLGIQQFFKELDFTDYITDFDFLSKEELSDLFNTTDTNKLTDLLDHSLEKRFCKFENNNLVKAIAYIFEHYENFSVTEISDFLEMSRQHLNRLFQFHLGVSIKKFHEIVLFRQTINKKLFENPDQNFTELAHEFNFNDQSHFNKTYKKLTENSPKTFFEKGTVFRRRRYLLAFETLMFQFYKFFIKKTYNFTFKS